LSKINQNKSKTLIAYLKKEVIIVAFNEARLYWRALFLLREYLFAEIFLDLFPFSGVQNPSLKIAMKCRTDGQSRS
jgi:hypothetical protein